MISIEEGRVRLTNERGETIIGVTAPECPEVDIDCQFYAPALAVSPQELKGFGGAVRGLAQKVLDRRRKQYLAARKAGTAAPSQKAARGA